MLVDHRNKLYDTGTPVYPTEGVASYAKYCESMLGMDYRVLIRSEGRNE